MKSYMLVLLAFVISISWIMGCKKEKNDDPFASLNNQLVCEINGNGWKSNDHTVRFYDFTPFQGEKFIYLQFRNGSQVFDFVINAPYSNNTKFNQNTNTYPGSAAPKDYAAFIIESSGLGQSEEYLTNTNDMGEMYFEVLDTNNKKIKARFSFTGKSNQTGENMTITNGFFAYHP